MLFLLSVLDAILCFFFFFNDTATTEIYTLSLHDALPISIVLASGNAGKIREIQAILQNDRILPQSQFNVVEPEETGSTFVENAIIKARNAALHCQLPAIADDSGLVVDALQGAPGVISARYAGVSAIAP